jgi:hypothetical protein
VEEEVKAHIMNDLEFCDVCFHSKLEIFDNQAPPSCPGKIRDALYYWRKSRLRRSRLWADALVRAAYPEFGRRP